MTLGIAARSAITSLMLLSYATACSGDGGGAQRAEDGGTGRTEDGGTGETNGTNGSNGSDTTNAGGGNAPESCDADDDDQRAERCNGRDCDDTNPAVTPDAPTDLNLTGELPPDTVKRHVLQLVSASADDFFVLYRRNDAELWLGRWSTGTWSSEAAGNVPVRSDEGAAMALDADGHVHIALVSEVQGSEPLTRDLYYLTNVTGQWVSEQLTDTTAADQSAAAPTIAIDGDGHVHVGARSSGLLHIANASGTWVQSILSKSLSSARLLVDAAGTVHMVYTTGFDLYHGAFANGAFEIQGPIEDAGGGELAALFDIKGRIHAAAVGYDFDASRKALVYTIVEGATATRLDPEVSYPGRPQLSRGPDGSMHLFSDIKLSTGHLVGLVHVTEEASGAKTETIYSTPSYVQDPFGFAFVDGLGRLHRISEGFSEHTYSDSVDNDCDGALW